MLTSIVDFYLTNQIIMYFDEDKNYQYQTKNLNIIEDIFQPTELMQISTLQFGVPTIKTSGNQTRSVEENSIYYEITLVHCQLLDLELTNPYEVGIGLSIPNIFDKSRLDTFVGWEDDSVGFHLDNGGFYNNEGRGNPKISDYIGYSGITIGICWNLKNGTIYFTRNGKIMKDINNNVIEMKRNYDEIKLYPTITCRYSSIIKFKVNYGDNVLKKPFKFDKFNLKTIFSNNIKNYYSDISIITLN